MALFPDEFPFNKREVEAPAEQAAAPAAPAEMPLFKVGPILDEVPAARVAPMISAAPVVTIAAEVAMPAEAVESAAPQPVAMKERRRSPRQRLAARATLRIDHTGGNPLAVEIDNVSLLGIRFRAGRELLVGDKANIRLEVGPLKWATRLRVINCLQTDANVYAIGCEFVGNELARPYTVAA
jgi:hypothetical protein